MKKILLILAFCLSSLIGTQALADEQMPAEAPAATAPADEAPAEATEPAEKPDATQPEENACKPSCEGMDENKCKCTDMDGNKCCVEVTEEEKKPEMSE